MGVESGNQDDFVLGTSDFTIELYRLSPTLTVHTQKSIDGVLYMLTQVFDEHQSMLSETLVRADLVRG